MDLKHGTQQLSINLDTIFWLSVTTIFKIELPYSKKREINFTSGKRKKTKSNDKTKSSKHLTIGELSHKDTLKAIRIHL